MSLGLLCVCVRNCPIDFFCCQIVLFKQLKTFYRDEKLERKAKFYFFCKKRKPALLVICYLKTSRWGKQ